MLPVAVKYSPTALDVWGIGISIVIGGQFFGWSDGLNAGTASFGLAIALMGSAYLCLIYSLAEITSALPFAGGVYGLARCTLGFHTGFILGCCEIIEYLMYVTSANLITSHIWIERYPSLSHYEPLVWVINHCISLYMGYVGGRTFWKFNLGLALMALSSMFFYFLGSMFYANITTQAGGPEFAVVGGFTEFFSALPQAVWMFSGIEGVNTFANDISNPKSTIPRGQLASVYTLLVTAVAIYLASISFAPGAQAIPGSVAILNGGFMTSLNITDSTASFFSMPAVFASIPGFHQASSNILAALARSQLFPPMLAHRHLRYRTPQNALNVTALLSFVLCFLCRYFQAFGSDVFRLGICFGFLSYIAQCGGYIYLKRRHKLMKRLYLSPVGTLGAVYSAVVFTFGTVSLLFCQDDHQITIFITIAIIALLSIYYHFFARYRQMFSKDEQTLLFFVHLGEFACSFLL